MLYLHGGGYVIGSPQSHRHLAASIAVAGRASVLLPDYRLAPEHPFPAALEDAVAAYRWLLDRGTAPRRIVIAGDSAGGGLTVATLARAARARGAAARRRRLHLAVGGPHRERGLLCHQGRHRSHRDPRRRDGDGTRVSGRPPTRGLRWPRRSSPISPGSRRCSSRWAPRKSCWTTRWQLAERAKAAGVEATLEVWPEMVHVWQWFFPMLDEGRTAIDGIGAFVQAKTA